MFQFNPSEQFMYFLVFAASVVVICALAIPVLITWLNRRADIPIAPAIAGQDTRFQMSTSRTINERQAVSLPALTALFGGLRRVTRLATSPPTGIVAQK